MIHTKVYNTIIGVLALASLGLSSCRHKDLYMEEDLTSRLEVVFDWRNAPDANPESMALYMYENNGRNPMRFIFSNKTGGEIKIPFGTRHAICMNADMTDWARMRGNESIETMEIFTGDAPAIGSRATDNNGIPRPDGAENERIASTPGMMWGSRTDNIRITPHDGTQTITMYPEECVCHYMVDIYDVNGLEAVESSVVDGTLSGMAEGYNHGQHSATDNTSTMKFDLYGNEEEKNLHGEFLTFGECPVNKTKHWLSIYIVLNDGSKWYHHFDVTDQVTNAPDPRHVHIIVRGLDLPDDPYSNPPGTELEADINEWQAINVDLEM